MIYRICLCLVLFVYSTTGYTQNKGLERLNFLLGSWEGTGKGFGNNTSTIEATYELIMDGRYIEVKHESHFAPTAMKLEGEHHTDKGFISFDADRKKIVYRQFNNEGYINQYVLNENLSSTDTLIFETEIIENFVEGGKARLTLRRGETNQLETVFDVSFPGKDYACFGTNTLLRK